MELNKTLTKTEEGFNFAGSLPLVAIVSGALRMLVGTVQAIAGAIIGMVGLVGMIVNPESRKWEDISKSALENFAHGGMNLFRGFGEYILGLTVFGTLGLLALQLTSENKFQPIIKYHQDPKPAFEPVTETPDLSPTQVDLV